MAVLLITYDLNNEVRRPPIVKFIKDKFDWAKLSESSYAIDTTFSTAQVYQSLLPLLDGDDNLLVLTLNAPYSGRNRKDVVDWLAAKL